MPSPIPQAPTARGLSSAGSGGITAGAPTARLAASRPSGPCLTPLWSVHLADPSQGADRHGDQESQAQSQDANRGDADR